MAQTVEISLGIPSLRVRREGKDVECEVVRSDWRDGKNMFVVACPGDLPTSEV